MWTLRQTLSLTIICASATVARADILVNTFGPSGLGYVPSVGWNIDSSQSLGKTFTIANAYNLDSIEIALRIDSGETDQFLVNLRDDSEGHPQATLESFVVTNAFGQGTAGVYTLNSVVNPLMAAGTYHITIEPLNGSTGKWNLNNGGGQGLMIVSNDAGANWSSFTDTNGAVRVHGTQVVPEPMTIIAAGMGFAALLRRKRK